MDFASTKARLNEFVGSGKLGPFAGGYWGHPAYALTPEENLLLVTHYLYALREQTKAARMHALFGAKNPHTQSLRVGGVTCRNEINGFRINEFRSLLSGLRNFVDTVYLPDVKYLATRYRDWSRYGSSQNYLCYGDFPLGANEPADFYFPRGVIFDRDLTKVQNVDLSLIYEHVARSWYAGAIARHPSRGETLPDYTDYDTEARYSWLKAPRYAGRPMEVGPLARVLVAYGSGHAEIVLQVEKFLNDTELTLSDLHSTLGRIAARALETKVIADAMGGWLNGLKTGDATFVTSEMPEAASGYGLNEAPRGALGHWINISNQKIGNYQMVVPSTWNLGPRCAAGKRGPVEEALIGTPVLDPEEPVEILRIVHSFDPCIACAVHVIDTKQDKRCVVRVA